MFCKLKELNIFRVNSQRGIWNLKVQVAQVLFSGNTVIVLSKLVQRVWAAAIDTYWQDSSDCTSKGGQTEREEEKGRVRTASSVRPSGTHTDNNRDDGEGAADQEEL